MGREAGAYTDVAADVTAVLCFNGLLGHGEVGVV